jgi:Holliday junction resolvase RusA-like endonuclease
MNISFHLPISPPKATSQTKRLVMSFGKPRFFPTKAHQTAERELLALCAPYAPARPLRGPLRLAVTFVFPWRTAEPKKRRALGKAYCDTRPDLDNMVKLVADVLTKKGFYEDDGQISVLHIAKFWGDQIGISVDITPLT